ncbi:MAG: pyruvate, phosphate dikinase, partial [Desulfobacteraceae bacterium]|nr:pyruvate, phosphate dikinase [Desulfobacteraceae bacterium]
TCSFTQYLDIFKGFVRAVADVINDYFHNIHSANLQQIEARIGKDKIQRKYLPKNIPDQDHLDEKMAKKLDQRAADIFFRDRIATSLGLQQLDVFLNRILHTLFRQSEKLSQDELSVLLNYDPKCAVTPIGDEQLMNQNIIFLGNKGWNLMRLKHLGVKVPDGFIITTEVFRCLDLIDTYTPASVNFKQLVATMLSRLEKQTGLSCGDPKKPLLLSVRSGSSISQPGMMDSFLNVGINEEIAAAIAKKTGNPWFAWDSYRRFLQQYGMTFGIHRDEFDQIIAVHKKEAGINFKRHFTGSQMKQVALAYKNHLLRAGIDIVESPMDQLFLAIHKVFSSWNSQRAIDYRRIMGISDDWGTAVTVQSMIFGNLSRQSGSGVAFSHSPKLPGDAIRLWGDFTIGNQGEDVVAGLVRTLPISEMQRELERRDTKISLEKAFPRVYEQLRTVIQRLIYKRGWNPQEMEFTFEGSEPEDLFILQARDLSLGDRKKQPEFTADDTRMREAFLGQGTGVSGGAMSGRIVFTLKEIDAFRRQDPDACLILLRNDTVPDDILEIDAADGILTAKGGLTSHAAVVAYNLGKTCVVGCENLVCSETEKTCLLAGRTPHTAIWRPFSTGSRQNP